MYTEMLEEPSKDTGVVEQNGEAEFEVFGEQDEDRDMER